MDGKICTKCKIHKPFSAFGRDRNRGPDGLTYRCKECRNPESKKWRDQNPEKVKDSNKKWKEKRKEYYNSPERKLKYKNNYLKQTYGLTINEYHVMLENQNGACKICKRPERFKNNQGTGISKLAVDHCHTTGKIRGLLCQMCNKALGAFEDNISLLEDAIKYLKESK